MYPKVCRLNRAAAWSTSSNTYEVVWWIGTLRDPVTASGRAPAWTARVANPYASAIGAGGAPSRRAGSYSSFTRAVAGDGW